MASYLLAGVCDARHRTRDDALKSMIGLVRDEYYYAPSDPPPMIMRRTPLIGIGSHGGSGLFLLGHCAGFDWERLPGEYAPYRHRIDVLWEGAIYGRDEREVLEGIERFDGRSWTAATHRDFGLVQARILEGEVVARVRAGPRSSLGVGQRNLLELMASHYERMTGRPRSRERQR